MLGHSGLQDKMEYDPGIPQLFKNETLYLVSTYYEDMFRQCFKYPIEFEWRFNAAKKPLERLVRPKRCPIDDSFECYNAVADLLDRFLLIHKEDKDNYRFLYLAHEFGFNFIYYDLKENRLYHRFSEKD